MTESMRPQDSFNAVVTKYENRLLRTAYAIVKNREDAEDILHEVFITYLEKHPAFASEEHEKAWLITVTVNKCKSLLRSFWHKHTTSLDEEFTRQTSEENDTSELFDTVMSLPLKYRTVIHLYYYEGYSTREISSITHQKESTVRSLMSRARQMLKEQLKD